MALAEQAHRAASLLEAEDYVRIACHADGDGLAAAGILCRALQREGVDFHVTGERELSQEVVDRLAAEGQRCLVLMDLAPQRLDLTEAASHVIVVDHHDPPDASPGDDGAGDVLQVNAADHRADGSREACTASVALVVALALSRRNVHLYPLALAGVVADRQHLGGLKGLNAELLAEAREAGLDAPVGLLLPHHESLRDGLAQCPDPFLRGLAGRARAANRFLAELTLDPEAAPGDLSVPEQRRVASALTLHLLDQGAAGATADAVLGPRPPVPVGGVASAHDLAGLLEACGAADQPGLALALLLGADVLPEVRRLDAERRPALLQALLRLDREGLEAEDGGVLARFEGASPALLPAEAGLAAAYLASRSPVLLGSAPDGPRVRLELRRRPGAGAPDLHRALRDAAEGTGIPLGGHAAAAWARVPADETEPLVARLNATLEAGLEGSR